MTAAGETPTFDLKTEVLSGPISNAFCNHVPGYNCYGCGDHNKLGLLMKVQSSVTVPGDMVCRFIPKPEHCGMPGVFHGGLIGVLFDCLAEWVCCCSVKKIGFTTTFDITYVKPAFSGRELTVRGRLVEAIDGKKARVHTELYDETGALCARAVVVYAFPSHATMVRLVGEQSATDLAKAVAALPFVAPAAGVVKSATAASAASGKSSGKLASKL